MSAQSDSETNSARMTYPMNRHSFWEEGQYEMTIKRLLNGKRSINDLLFMVRERAEIERTYAEKMFSWFGKWEANVRKGPEFGEVEKIWLDILAEGRKVAGMHMSVSLKLDGSPASRTLQELYSFKKSNYHKVPLVNELREVKECRDAFKAAQATYKKAMETINKLRKKYVDSARVLVQLSSRLANNQSSKWASVDSAQSSRLRVSLNNKEKAKQKYLAAIHHFDNHVRDDYVVNMETQFKRCQEFELRRMTAVLNGLHGFINDVNPQYHTSEPLSSIYSKPLSYLIEARPESNLLLFSKLCGPQMAKGFPRFEGLESRIGKNSRAMRMVDPPGNDRTSDRTTGQLISHKSESEMVGAAIHTRTFMLRRPSNIDSLSSAHSFTTAHRRVAFKGEKSGNSDDSAHLSNPSEDSRDLSSMSTSTDHYSLNNIYVKVITSYNDQIKPGRLQIHKGDVVYQLRGDVDGWCYGRLACTEGYYPSNAVQVLKMNISKL